MSPPGGREPPEGSDVSFTTDDDGEGGNDAVYDDVYSCQDETTTTKTDNEAPPVERDNRSHKRKSVIRPLNEYENVVIHNLTESLKRKLMPKRMRTKDSFLGTSIATVPEGVESKENSKAVKLSKNSVVYPGLKPKPKPKKPKKESSQKSQDKSVSNGKVQEAVAEKPVDEQVRDSQSLECLSGVNNSQRSSGVEVEDNDIYQNKDVVLV